jgi:hypothetical protein
MECATTRGTWYPDSVASALRMLMGRPRSEWPDIRWLDDPMDLVPLSFDVTDAAWSRDDKAARIRRMCD